MVCIKWAREKVTTVHYWSLTWALKFLFTANSYTTIQTTKSIWAVWTMNKRGQYLIEVPLNCTYIAKQPLVNKFQNEKCDPLSENPPF